MATDLFPTRIRHVLCSEPRPEDRLSEALIRELEAGVLRPRDPLDTRVRHVRCFEPGKEEDRT